MRGEEHILDPLALVETDKIVELTKTLISKPSISGKEHELVDWLENYFKYIGITDVKRLPVEEAGDTLIGWVKGKGDGPTVMLNFHVDTFNAFEGWETERARQRGDEVGFQKYGQYDGVTLQLNWDEAAIAEQGITKLGPR